MEDRRRSAPDGELGEPADESAAAEAPNQSGNGEPAELESAAGGVRAVEGRARPAAGPAGAAAGGV